MQDAPPPLVIGRISVVMQDFDAPVAADPAGGAGRAGRGDGQAGDRAGGDGAPSDCSLLASVHRRAGSTKAPHRMGGAFVWALIDGEPER